MKIFEGKTPAERNKIIAAGVLGAMALLVVVYNIMNLYPSRKTSVAVTTASPTPAASSRPPNLETVGMPSKADEIFGYTTNPIDYKPGSFYAPDAGRNIFAFYEPPPPTPIVEQPVIFIPPTPLPTPTPTPVPPLFVEYVTPQSVYAGSKTFRLEVSGDKFTPDSAIYLNGSQLPTTFVNPQRVYADVPSNMIAGGAGALQIIVRTPDGALYSNPVMITVQAPPRPQLQYIGMIARKRFNNDTAYFQEKDKPTPMGARLNDVVGGRFRITSISASEVVMEDVNLGFKHKLALYRPAPGQSTPGGVGPRSNPNEGIYNTFNPGTYIPPQGEIPGIPSNIPRYVPPQPQPAPSVRPKPAKSVSTDDDDDDDGGK